jgi:hypothetical protein
MVPRCLAARNLRSGSQEDDRVARLNWIGSLTRRKRARGRSDPCAAALACRQIRLLGTDIRQTGRGRRIGIDRQDARALGRLAGQIGPTPRTGRQLFAIGGGFCGRYARDRADGTGLGWIGPARWQEGDIDPCPERHAGED